MHFQRTFVGPLQREAVT